MADSSLNTVFDAVLAFINAESLLEKKRIVEAQHDLLLTADIDRAFMVLLPQYQDNANAMQRLQQHHALLMRCRQQGIDAAFADLIRSNSNSTNELRRLWNEINSLTRPQQMPRRIDLCRQALSLVQRESQSDLWATLQNELANSLAQTPLGNRADNIEQAIHHYEQALLVRTPPTFPADWAATQNNLAAAYWSRIRGQKADNIEQAITYLKQALMIYTPQAFPEKWAETQNNLAGAYWSRIRGQKADNIEQAITYLKQALTILTRQAFPSDWAMTQNNLAGAYLSRIRGNRAANVEQAIDHCKKALLVRTPQAFPADWAATQNNLANAYRNRIRGNRADNIEQAIHHYQKALLIRTRPAFPADWAMTQNNLANAYSHRIRGNRADNIEQAIDHYQQALQIYTRPAFPADWAGTQNNLANAYSHRIRGQRADNIEQAIDHYEEALLVRTRPAFPADWAMTQNNLALAYNDRIRGQWALNIEQSITHFQQALTIYTQPAFPADWAATQNNLALAYNNRIRGQRKDNIEQAIHHYQEALKVYRPQAFPEKWAMTQNNLAVAYSDRIKGDQALNIEQAIHYYRQALLEYTPVTWPERCRSVAYRLGRLFYNEGRFKEARQALATAHEAAEALRSETQREGDLRQLADENAGLYARLVFCCLHEALNPSPLTPDSLDFARLQRSSGRREHVEAAFEYAAAGKGRAFVDQLSSLRVDLSQVGQEDSEFRADWQRYREMRQEIDGLLLVLTGDKAAKRVASGQAGLEGLPREVIYRQLRDKQQAAAQHWQQMTYNYLALTACQSAPSLSAAQARNLSAQLNATLVEYYRHAEGWCAFVVSADEVRHVALPLLTEGFLEEMADWTKEIRYPAGRASWTVQMLDRWYEAVIAPLQLNHTTSAEVGAAMVLSPFGALRYLPLFSARQPETKQYIAQMQQLAFAPSLGALRVAYQSRRQQKSEPLDTLLSVAYAGEPPLPNVIPEAQAVATYATQATLLQQKDATPDAVIKQAGDKQALHLGCHGIFNPQHEAESGLMLSGGWLTLQRILTELHLKACDLVTLGACQSWVLTQAVMTAGASSVVSSLWSVDDSATRALFEAFYAHIANGHPPANALRQATELIRQQPNWQHPFYWAPFTVNGLAHGLLPSAKQPVRHPIDKVAQHIRTLHRTTTRGTLPMNENRIKVEATIYLKGIAHMHKQLATTLNPIEGALLVQTLAMLSQQVPAIQSEAQLLALCDTIHNLVEELSALRDVLVPEQSDIARNRQARAVTINDIISTQKPLDQRRLALIDATRLETPRQQLDEALPKLDDTQKEEVKRRLPRFLAKLGIK